MSQNPQEITVQHKTRPDRNSNSDSKTVLEANLVGGDKGKTPQVTNLGSSGGKETVRAADPAVATK